MQHGTLGCYNSHKCRCDECRRASADYHRDLRIRNGTTRSMNPNGIGRHIRFDAIRTRVLMARDGRTNSQLARDAGVSLSALQHSLSRGSCVDTVLDNIACALGIHPSQLEV